MVSDLIIGLLVFCYEVIVGFVRGVCVFVTHVLGWPVIIASVIGVWALWRFGFM